MTRTTPRLCALLVLLVGCAGEEVGRVAFHDGDAGQATVTLSADKPVHFWADIDVAYEGQAKIQYEVELAADGATVATVTCDALDTTSRVASKRVLTADGGDIDYKGKMRCEAEVPKTGAYELRARFSAEPAPTRLGRHDLVITQ
ncbi:MAG: hypothetical protein R3A51_11600 [Nannocystaceae bacterium]|nr:hypothetical protein [Myxococcales bacterium]